MLYDIISLYANIVIDSLTHHGIGPTALMSISDPGFHFYKNNPEINKFQWTKIDSESPELFVVDSLDLVELCPIGVPIYTGYRNRGIYHITMTHLESSSQNMLRDATSLPTYTKVSRNIRNWLWRIPSTKLRESIKTLDTVLWRESYGTDRQGFVRMLNDVRNQLEKFRYQKKYFDIIDDAAVLSGIPSQTLEIYYEKDKQKIIKSSLDKTLESWYKLYSKKIKYNHF